MDYIFDKNWFKKHQKKLVWFANTKIGKRFFAFQKMGHYLEKGKPIIKITPNSVAQHISIKGKRVKIKEQFFIRNEYARKLYFYLLPVWYLMHFWDWLLADRYYPRLSFGFNTLTTYPDGIPVTTQNGYVGKQGVDQTWATIISGDGTYAGVGSADTGSFTYNASSATPNQWTQTIRSTLLFDTSSLTSSAIISAAVLSLFGSSKSDGLVVTPDIDIYISNPASNTNTVIYDYGNFGSISQTGSPITYANWSTSAYNDFTFNATGRGNVSKTGISKFGTRNANYDVAANAPTWSSSQSSGVSGYYAISATNKPKLVVTYTLPVVVKSIPNLLLMNVG